MKRGIGYEDTSMNYKQISRTMRYQAAERIAHQPRRTNSSEMTLQPNLLFKKAVISLDA